MNTNTTNQPMTMTGELAICERRIFARGGIIKRTEFEVTAPAVIDGLNILNYPVAGPFNTLAEAATALDGGR